jgi:hypothetical protein
MRGYCHEFQHPETQALHIHRVFGNLQAWLNGTHHGVDPNTCKIISMNLSFVSTADKHPWQLSKHSPA